MKTRRDVFQAIALPTVRAIMVLLAVGAITHNAIAEHFNSSRFQNTCKFKQSAKC